MTVLAITPSAMVFATFLIVVVNIAVVRCNTWLSNDADVTMSSHMSMPTGSKVDRVSYAHVHHPNRRPVTAPAGGLKPKALYIGGIFPMSGSWAGGRGCRPAVDMALKDINQRRDILSEYRLEMLANDSQCQPGLGMKVLYDLVYNKPVKLMLLGPGCSVVSTFVGQAARMWNLVVLSYGSSSPALSNKKRFPTFFRTHPSATLHNPTRVKLFQKFGWRRIATIQETQEVFTSTMEDLEERAQRAGIEVAVRTNFHDDPKSAVRNLLMQNARIIVGLFYEDKARRVFCEAYKQKLYGPRYVWFIIGWYADNWWSTPRDTDCTVEQMREVLEGHFTTEGLMLNQDQNIQSISGLTARDFTKKMEKRIKDQPYGKDVIPLSVTGYVEAPLAYDAVWALALALDKAQLRLKTFYGKSLEDFDYSKKDIMTEIYAAMNSTNFVGVSGHVAFNSEGDRITLTQIEQMSGGNYTRVGFYNISSDNLTWFDNETWLGGKVPGDRTTVKMVLRTIQPSVFIAACLLSLLGILASLVLLTYNIIHRHSRIIEASQPQLNNIMLVGCILCFFCIFLNGLDGKYLDNLQFTAVCQARSWILCVGFTLSYGSMFTKVWAVYRFATQRQTELQVVKECELYVVLGVLLILDVVIMTAWQLVEPFERVLENFPPELTDTDIELLPQLEHCSSPTLYIWHGVMFGYKGILLLFGTLLVYETRNIKMKQINDSRFVAMSMGNVLVLTVITVPVTLTISSHHDATFMFSSLAILLCNFLSMGLIFVPKMFDANRTVLIDDQDNAVITNNSNTFADDEQYKHLLQENENLRLRLFEKEQKIRDLHSQILKKSVVQLPVCQS